MKGTNFLSTKLLLYLNTSSIFNKHDNSGNYLFYPPLTLQFVRIPTNLKTTSISYLSYKLQKNKLSLLLQNIKYYIVLRSYLGEVAHKMAALPVYFCQNIKHEGLHIKVKSFVIQKQFGQ